MALPTNFQPKPPPPMTAGAKGAHKTYSTAALARRKLRLAEGIKLGPNGTKSVLSPDALRKRGLLPSHDEIAKKVAASRKEQAQATRSIPVLGTADSGQLRPAAKKRKKGGPAGGKNSVTGSTMSASGTVAS